MRRQFVFALALLCTAAAGGWHLGRLHGGAAASPEAPIAERYQLEWDHSTEQEWIVDDIAEAILGLQGPSQPAGPRGRAEVTALADESGAPRFSIALHSGRSIPITIDHHIWSPSTYAPLAAAVVGAYAGPTEAATPPASSLEALTRPLAEVIQQENLRISAVLQADLRSADAHEEAALILAALALREAAGDFSDPRRIMSRMTAHLAVAGQLRQTLGIAGRVANAALLTLTGRERDAVDVMRELDGMDSPGLRPWLRALRLRNTNDWRATRKEPSLTLFEQFETLRAIKTTLGNDPAVEYVIAFRELVPTPIWARILLQGSASVEIGNTIARFGPGSESEEARQILATIGGSADLTPERFITALNIAQQPSSVDALDGTVRVIDWGLWAAASQRHLVMTLHAGHRHLHQMQGQRQSAQAFAREVETFAALTMFPLLRPYMADDRASYDRAIAGVVDLCRRRPDLVTFEVWEYLHQKPSFAGSSVTAIPPSGPWFTPLFPAGTVFDVSNRAFDDTVTPPQARLTLAAAQRLRTLAPTERIVATEAVRFEHGNWPAYTVMQREYGELTAYDLSLARRVARAAAEHPDACVPLMRHVGELNPESLAELGAYLADRGRAAEAQAVYEEWIEKARNEVGVANGVWWLVRRYHETGQPRKAETLARRAADVHSYWGLVTLADLHDWRGEISAARRLYETAAERYENYTELLAFYLRRSDRDALLKFKVDDVAPRIFPAGLEAAALGDFTTEPTDGVTLVEVGDSGRRAGLRNHDIVVAVDGTRVRNFKQYRAARGRGTAPDLTLIVWRQREYLELQVPLRYGWPVSNLQDFVRGRATVATR